MDGSHSKQVVSTNLAFLESGAHYFSKWCPLICHKVVPTKVVPTNVSFCIRVVVGTTLVGTTLGHFSGHFQKDSAPILVKTSPKQIGGHHLDNILCGTMLHCNEEAH